MTERISFEGTVRDREDDVAFVLPGTLLEGSGRFFDPASYGRYR